MERRVWNVANSNIKFAPITNYSSFGNSRIKMLTDQIALVTGASRGIGRGIAVKLAEAGATVYITAPMPSNEDATV